MCPSPNDLSIRDRKSIMKTNPDTRSFYEQLYRQKPETNPAHEIYDELRVRYIRELAQSCRGPILIAGCGSHRDFEIFDDSKRIFAFDLSSEAIKKHSINSSRVFAADARLIPLAEERFGLIICSEVLEHIPNIRTVVQELRRVIRSDGILIVSSPNWHSWFGLARFIGEHLLRRPLHSTNQPYDDWKTPKRYTSELSPEFCVTNSRGAWYLPPMHYGKIGVPRPLVRLIYQIYAPYESRLSRRLPEWGHILILKCIPV